MSSATSREGLLSLSLRCATLHSVSTTAAWRATSCATKFRRARPSSSRVRKVVAFKGKGSAMKARSNATSMICSRRSSTVPKDMNEVLIFCTSGRFFSRYFKGSRNCSATKRRRPAWWRTLATCGSSKTSISTWLPRSIKAGKPIRVWPPRLISNSSGNSPKTQSVWRAASVISATTEFARGAALTICAPTPRPAAVTASGASTKGVTLLANFSAARA